MAESENDSLSVEDLLSAFGAPGPRPKPEPKSSAAPVRASGSASAAPSMSEDELDLLSALGLAAPSSATSTPSALSSTSRAAINHEKRERASFKDAARKEQQIRSQQWQQELRRREARMARMQTPDQEIEQMPGFPQTEQTDLPPLEEGGLSKKPSRPAVVEGGFERPEAYNPYHIPEPSFLSAKEASAQTRQIDHASHGGQTQMPPMSPVQSGAPVEQTQPAQYLQTPQPSHMQPLSQMPAQQMPMQPTGIQQMPVQAAQAPQATQGAQATQVAQVAQQMQPQQLPVQQGSQQVRPADEFVSYSPEQSIQPMQQMQSMSEMAPGVAAVDETFTAEEQSFEPVHDSSLQPFGSFSQTDFSGFNRRVIEPLSSDIPSAGADESGIELGAEPGVAGEPASPSAANVSSAPDMHEATPHDMSASEGVIKRSFFPTATPISSIQRLDEAPQPASSLSPEDQESLVERRQIPLSASTDALSTGVIGSIQPVPGGYEQGVQQGEDTSADQEIQPYTDAPDHVEQYHYQDQFQDQNQDQFQDQFQTTAPSAEQFSQDATYEFDSDHLDQSIDADPYATTPATPFQPSAPLPPTGGDTAQIGQFDSYGEGGYTNQYMPAPHQGDFGAQQPMPPMPPAPMAPVAGPMHLSDEQLDIQRNTVSSKRNNVLGIILIAVALLCAIMAIGMLSGLFNMNPTPASSASSSASSSSQISDIASDPNSSQAVYTYVVRGVDGTTHEATETALFNADGFLEGSTIELEVSDADTANALLEQLKSEFGASVVNSEADENHVRIDLDINRDDLTKEAYTELLLANMTEFKQVS